MAIIFSQSSKSDSYGRNEILIRYKSGNLAARTKTDIFIDPEWYNFVIGKIVDTPNKGKRIITEKMRNDEEYHKKQKTILSEIDKLISDTLKTKPDRTNSDWLTDTIDKFYQRGKHKPIEKKSVPKQSFFDIFDEYLEKSEVCENRKRHYLVLCRALKRYELYNKTSKQRNFELSFDTITPDTIQEFEQFLKSEHLFSKQYPEIYKAIPECRDPKKRGHNTINGILKKFRTVILWANQNKKTNNNPDYKIKDAVYGTPVYITTAERNKLYETDLSQRPQLEVQRDIFVFQCLIGCRVGDLYRLTKNNIINGAIEYIARKTKDVEPLTVRIPLNKIASEILNKYKEYEGETLFPFITEQKYNVAIKEMFKVAGLTRSVVVLDPLTRESVIKPLNEIASSHLARRTFVGNLYNQVKDPNLIGALSGHTDGSRSFSRYRKIDENLKIELVKMLE